MSAHLKMDKLKTTLQNVNNKGADQTAWMRRLVCAFIVRKADFVSQIDGSNRPLKQIFNNYKIKSSRFCLKYIVILFKERNMIFAEKNRLRNAIY